MFINRKEKPAFIASRVLFVGALMSFSFMIVLMSGHFLEIGAD